MTPLEIQCDAILRAAISAECGLVVKTNDPNKARLALYRTRRLVGDSDYDQLSIRVSPDDSESELWIIRNASRLLDIKATDLLDA